MLLLFQWCCSMTNRCFMLMQFSFHIDFFILSIVSFEQLEDKNIRIKHFFEPSRWKPDGQWFHTRLNMKQRHYTIVECIISVILANHRIKPAKKIFILVSMLKINHKNKPFCSVLQQFIKVINTLCFTLLQYKEPLNVWRR